MINNVTLVGRLTKLPELKKTTNGVSVSTFDIAVDRKFKNNDGEKVTDFITCVAWRGTADFICKYFNKGNYIALTGAIQTRKYEDKDGNKRTAFEIIVDNASFCGVKDDGGAGSEAPANTNYTVVADTDDLPF